MNIHNLAFVVYLLKRNRIIIHHQTNAGCGEKWSVGAALNVRNLLRLYNQLTTLTNCFYLKLQNVL
jgi:hypothetical protein